jgi:hypothetical protein
LETSPFLCTNSAISAFFSFRDFLRVETGPVAFAIQPDDDLPFGLTVPRELHGFSQLPQELNMRYQMRQKFFAFGDDFMIKDQDGNDIYFVDGKAFSWGDKLSFQRADTREEIAFIAQKLWSFKPKYEIHRDGNVFAEVVKEFAWFKSKFTLDVPGPTTTKLPAASGSRNTHSRASAELSPRSRRSGFRSATRTASTSFRTRTMLPFSPRRSSSISFVTTKSRIRTADPHGSGLRSLSVANH